MCIMVWRSVFKIFKSYVFFQTVCYCCSICLCAVPVCKCTLLSHLTHAFGKHCFIYGLLPLLLCTIGIVIISGSRVYFSLICRMSCDDYYCTCSYDCRCCCQKLLLIPNVYRFFTGVWLDQAFSLLILLYELAGFAVHE